MKIAFPINWTDIAQQAGSTSGKLAYSKVFESWAVFVRTGEISLIDPPRKINGIPIKSLRIVNRQWEAVI